MNEGTLMNLVGEGRFELPISCSQGTRLEPARPLPDLVARHGIEPYPLAFQTSTLPSSSRAKLWWTVRDSNSQFTAAGLG